MTSHDVTIIGIYTFDGIPGIKFAQAGSIVYPLTPCCNASAKGSEGGIVCRKCYHEVPPGFGMGWSGNAWAREKARLEQATR